MKITRESPEEDIRYMIRGYGPGEIRVNDKVYTSSMILMHDRLDANWHPPEVSEWTPRELDPLLAHDPELILIGTGDTVRLLGTEFLAHTLKEGVALEVMDTAAACRTFNILVGEARRVVAGLIIE